MKIGIIGGGITGLTAGYELVKNGHQITIYESEPEWGGLAGTIKAGSEDLEKFYHHIFTSDRDLLSLLEELGLTSKLQWLAPKNGIFSNNRLYPFTSPLDLLMFKELSPLERVVLGLLIYRAKMVKDWKKLENINAKAWIIKNAGEKVYQKVWGPMLNSKFDCDADRVSAAWLWNKFKLRGSTRGKNLAKEVLGYLQGSFGNISRELANRISAAGSVIKCGAAVHQIRPVAGKSLEIQTGNGAESFERIIFTASPKILTELVSLPEIDHERLRRIKYKSNTCLVLELTQPLSSYYWISVADPAVPFVAVIEHTNLVPVGGYGSHLVYLSRYHDQDHELSSLSDAQVRELFLGNLKKIFPSWNESLLKRTHLHRAFYTQPVIVTGYSKIRPEMKTSVENLYLACMAQIYPEDRGLNYAVRLGREVAGIVNCS